MKTYSIATPPTCAGLYYLTNKRTGEVYVGQSLGLKRRYIEWKNALSSGFGHTNTAMFDAMTTSPDLDEWFFVVAKELPGATMQQLLAEEAAEIARLQSKIGDKCLNTAPSNLLAATPSDRVAILLPDGSMVGQEKASQLLNRHKDTIRDKIRWLKSKGITQVELDDLLLDRRKILQKY